MTPPGAELHNGLQHHSCQEGGDGDAVGLSQSSEGFGGDGCHRQVEETILLPGPLNPESIFLPAAHGNLTGHLQEAVFPLGWVRGHVPIQNSLLRWDGDAIAQGNIGRCQSLEKHQAAVAVCDGVEELHGNPVAEVQHPQGAGFQLPAGHVDQGTAAVRPYPRRFGNLLQVIPEKAPVQAHQHGGKAGGNQPDRFLQKKRVYRLRQGGGKPEHIAPVPPLDGGEYFGGVVQPHPLLRLRHRGPPLAWK